jgi:integrase
VGKVITLERPAVGTDVRGMELDGVPTRRDGRKVRLGTVTGFRTLSRMRAIQAFGPDLQMPYDTSPEGRGDKVTGAAVDLHASMVWTLVAQGVPLPRACTQADVADAMEARCHRRGRRPLGPRLIVRRQGKRPRMVYIKHGSTRLTTHIEEQPGVNFRTHPGAVAQLADYVETVVRRILGHILTKDVTMSQVYLQFLDAKKPGERADDLAKDYHKRLEYICEQLEEYNGNDSFDMLTIDSGIRYAKFRTAQQIKTQDKDTDPAEIRCVADVTARDHVRVLVSVAIWFCRLHGLPQLVIDKPKVRRKGLRHLTWDQLMRLLLAARGRTYNKEGCCVGRHGDSKRYECVVRFIMIYFCTGTRHKNILELLWAAHDKLGHIDAALLMIIRQGPGAPVTTKGRGTSDLAGPIRLMVPKWDKQDRRKRAASGSKQLFINVIHDEEGNPVTEHQMLRLFGEVRELAGLPSSVQPHMLKHTGVTLYTMAGMGEEDISFTFSTTTETLDAVYTHLHQKWRRPRRFARKNLRLRELRKFSQTSRENALAKPAEDSVAAAA